MVTCIGNLGFTAEKNIPVEKPFGSKKTREKRIADGKVPKVNIKPEFCLVSEDKGFIGEAVGGKDLKPSDKEYSESHQRIWELVENEILNSGQSFPDPEVKTRIYFAQKIMCQLFPVFLYLKNIKHLRSVKCFCALTARQTTEMEFVFKLLYANGYISSIPIRPLEYMDYDINKYGIAIYEINFPTGNLDQSWVNVNLDLSSNVQQD